jgi:DNA repair exonuclease SbcCD ATPase subunit
MQCERLIKLVKTWYLHVKEETMAPARMVQFIKQHVATCPVCKEDPNLQEEIDKISDIILPESKIPKAIRLRQELDEEIDEDDETSDDDTEEESDGDSDDLEEDEFAEEDDLAEDDDAEDDF